ncbi:MAG TPA: preprotein translocase subunit SecG, partial [Phycisphaerales bacterium]|nr:preprotein translocase subunit SecG [Phycisphaerales bacterium]
MLVTLALALWATNLLILLLLAIAILLILTVLIQRPQGGGLSAAFGSAGSGQTAFGTKTGDALTVFTVIMFALFVLVAIGLNFAMRPSTALVVPAIESTTPNESTNGSTGGNTSESTPAPSPDQGATGGTPATGGPENPAPGNDPISPAPTTPT